MPSAGLWQSDKKAKIGRAPAPTPKHWDQFVVAVVWETGVAVPADPLWQFDLTRTDTPANSGVAALTDTD